MVISYAITVCDEKQEIERLVNTLIEYIQFQDEIVILHDSKNGDSKVWEYLNLIALTDDNQSKGVNINKGEFNNNFSEWKNKLNSLCKGDYIFNIDADEIPHENLIKQLPDLLKANPNVDMLRVPRINTVEGITKKHLQQWGWSINEKGWINWADWQMRIYKNHPSIKWEGKVHETVKGFKVHGMLPEEEKWALYHPKTIDKQEKQNNYYKKL